MGVYSLFHLPIVQPALNPGPSQTPSATRHRRACADTASPPRMSSDDDDDPSNNDHVRGMIERVTQIIMVADPSAMHSRGDWLQHMVNTESVCLSRGHEVSTFTNERRDQSARSRRRYSRISTSRSETRTLFKTPPSGLEVVETLSRPRSAT